ncbi:MAG: hypothetical protein BWY45_00586 [Euryarchaeota archaeon ADurb.Bin294]|nr:MAG: hypothetical protein BWY45_00586 [Euryarchaeota archaeon ADurb.Bin294]
MRKFCRQVPERSVHKPEPGEGDDDGNQRDTKEHPVNKSYGRGIRKQGLELGKEDPVWW